MKSGATFLHKSTEWFAVEKRNQKNTIQINTNPESLKLYDEIDCGNSEIRNSITLDKIEKLADKLYAIEISFAIGPL